MYLIHGGPQPDEAILSNVCDAFTCTPPEAKDIDWRDAMEVLEYRMLSAAKTQHNEDITKMTPSMAALWVEMLTPGGVTGNGGG